MTAPKVKPFEHSCGTCGQTVKKVSVEGLIPMTVEEAAELTAQLICCIGEVTDQVFIGGSTTTEYCMCNEHPVTKHVIALCQREII